MQWRKMDIHVHTPASSDFQQEGVRYLDILKRAEARNLDMLAFTDHNTIAGYRSMEEEIQQLEMLEQLNRLLPEERQRLNEYRRLRQKILVLPGFEFTATFGFHILALFHPDKPTREIEHLLLDLRIPGDQLDLGSATVGATTDVLAAYRMINQAEGLVIAAHANSSNGVAMRGFPFGGQTKIAYTQDPNLHALEVTDLEAKGRSSSAAFFNGTKPEYPRRMHCIQGSDSHRLTADPVKKKLLGVGDRATEVLLPDVSFEALLELFTSNDFARTRPHRHTEEPAYDFVQAAREEGANIVQDFHESMVVRGGKRYAIIADICAFANTNGGTLYIGLGNDPRKPVIGVPDAEQAILTLEKEIDNRITPPLQCALDIHEAGSKKIVRVLIPTGADPPYAVDENKIYVRSETETGLAVRDEIVNLVRRGLPKRETILEAPPSEPVEAPPKVVEHPHEGTAPRTGVEVVSVEERAGVATYTMRDLRNGNVVKNVTRTSARRLWHYAITMYTKQPADVSQMNITWLGDLGLVSRTKHGKSERYDLIQRTPRGYRFYFGVTEDGVHGEWKRLLGQEDD
ncbi:MAG: putative DNA binding domain-containing protein [Anaerolineales bacterium]|nr:putative DNA binding domain-containing protein [Anaerolineales bacterium]